MSEPGEPTTPDDGSIESSGLAVEEGARVATVDDLDVIVALAELALEEQRSGRGGRIWAVRETRPAPFELSLRQAIHDPDQEVFVGTLDDDVIVGYAAVRAEHLRSGETLGVVDDLIVEPDARAIGVGEALIGQVIAWCDQRECVGIDSHALPGNRATKNFFETWGFKARLLVVHRPLR